MDNPKKKIFAKFHKKKIFAELHAYLVKFQYSISLTNILFIQLKLWPPKEFEKCFKENPKYSGYLNDHL
jgi:hypothetical protein